MLRPKQPMKMSAIRLSIAIGLYNVVLFSHNIDSRPCLCTKPRLPKVSRFPPLNYRMLFKKLPSLMFFLLLFLIAPVSPSLASRATLWASLSLASWALGIAAGKSILCCSRGIFGAAKARLGLALRALRSALAAMRRCFLDFAVGKVSRRRRSMTEATNRRLWYRRYVSKGN